jgi:RNA polymerase sigma factor (sigma-70 family)
MTTEQYNLCVDNHSDGLYRFLLGQLRTAEDARDLVQDAFEVLWLRHNEVDYSRAKSFLFRVAYRDMIDNIRKSKRLQLVQTMPDCARSTQIAYTGARDALDHALASLPEIQKTVVLLRDYEGYDYREIGEITGLSESQVKVYIYRAR